MIPRYSRPEMVAIWSPETRFRIWFEIEAHAADAQAELGVIPKAAAAAIWKAKDVEFDVARIDEIEAVTRHDVIAFLTHLAEHRRRRGALRAPGDDLARTCSTPACACSWRAPPTSCSPTSTRCWRR